MIGLKGMLHADQESERQKTFHKNNLQTGEEPGTRDTEAPLTACAAAHFMARFTGSQGGVKLPTGGMQWIL